MQEELARLDETLPNNTQVKLRAKGKNRIALSPLQPQPDPVHLVDLKAEVMRRWPMTSLLDVLKETDLRVGFTEVFKSLSSREQIGIPALSNTTWATRTSSTPSATRSYRATSSRISGTTDLLEY